MKISYTIVAVALVTGATACGQSDGVATETSEPTEVTEEQAVTEESKQPILCNDPAVVDLFDARS